MTIQHLMRLELKKTPFGKYILLSALAIVLGLFFLFVSLTDSSDTVHDFENAFQTAEMIFSCIFIVFFAVLNGALIISEYNNRTILLMFTYPVDKKLMIVAKLMVITLFIAVSLSVGYLCCGLFLAGIDRAFDLLADAFSGAVLCYFVVRAATTIVVYCCLGLWTFAAGMHRKSVTVTIVSSLLFIFLRQVVVASGKEPRESLGVMLVLITITALALWYTFRRKITELE